jgi:hypothetical protein
LHAKIRDAADTEKEPRLALSTPLRRTLRFFKGLGGEEGIKTCQKRKKAVFSQLDIEPERRIRPWLLNVKIRSFG